MLRISSCWGFWYHFWKNTHFEVNSFLACIVKVCNNKFIYTVWTVLHIGVDKHQEKCNYLQKVLFAKSLYEIWGLFASKLDLVLWQQMMERKKCISSHRLVHWMTDGLGINWKTSFLDSFMFELELSTNKLYFYLFGFVLYLVFTTITFSNF